MSSSSSSFWRLNNDCYVTTQIAKEYHPQLNALFARDDFHWAKPLSNSQLQRMLDNSLCFAIFKSTRTANDLDRTSTSLSDQLIGFGRWLTDYVTVVYVNDVYILEEFRGQGLARQLLGCMNDALNTMPDLRGTIMIVEKGTAAEHLYRHYFSMEDLVATDILLDRKGPGSTS